MKLSIIPYLPKKGFIIILIILLPIRISGQKSLIYICSMPAELVLVVILYADKQWFVFNNLLRTI